MAGTGSGQFDVIHHSGAPALDVSLLGGFMPTERDAFEIITAAGGVASQFTTLAAQLPSLAGGKQWSINYNPTSVVLAVLPPFDADFGMSGAVTHMQGDADGDLDVDGADSLTCSGSSAAQRPWPGAQPFLSPRLCYCWSRERWRRFSDDA